jgi:hypothetical protein
LLFFGLFDFSVVGVLGVHLDHLGCALLRHLKRLADGDALVDLDADLLFGYPVVLVLQDGSGRFDVALFGCACSTWLIAISTRCAL